ncbi:MAG: hypothetical protein HYS69_00750 [candidate division NC10 bacterium]|nr:hypothetical protein [candidate division NC10 bacterium]
MKDRISLPLILLLVPFYTAQLTGQTVGASTDLAEMKKLIVELGEQNRRMHELYDLRFQRLEEQINSRTVETLKAQGLADAREERIQQLELELEKLRTEQQGELERLEAEQARSAARLSEEVQKGREQIAPIIHNPRITMFGNLLGRTDDRPVISPEGDRVDDTFTLRAGEFELRGAIDPFADGFLTIPFEAETPNGPLAGDIEEGYLELKRLPFLERPPLGLKLKLGKYRPDIGKNNRIHFHDLMWTTRPLPVAKFLGTEGLGESAEGGFQAIGLNADFLLPFGSSNTSVRMVAGYAATSNLAVTAGFGRRPALYFHPSLYQNVAAEHSFELGGSYLRGTASEPGQPSCLKGGSHVIAR